MAQKRNILLLEDSAEDAELINIELSKADFLFNLEVVGTEGDFLNALKDFSPDLILADYTLPSYDGLSALLSTRETYSNVPFIFVSGTIGEEKAIEAFKNGLTDYIFKDNLAKLVPAAKRVLNEKDERQKRLVAEEGMRNAAHQWKATFDAIEDAVCLLSDEGKILRCNKAMAKFLGKPFEEIIGSTCWELVHGTEKPIPECPVLRMRETQLRETVTLPVEDKILQVTVDPVLDENGKVIQVVHIISDITEHERTEEALKESEEKYRSMMDGMEDAAYICSSDFIVEYMNPAMIKKTGRDATGETCYKVMHGLDEKCPWCIHENIMRDEYIKYDVVSPKDDKFYNVANSPIFHTNGSISKFTIFRDNTETKKMEGQLLQAQKMESIGTLAGGIAHDFNNILFPIVGYTELVMDDVPEGSREHKNLQEIFNASMRAKDLVRQILTLSRKGDQENKPLMAQLVVKEAIKFMRSSLPKTIEIHEKIDKNCGLIMGDSTQIHQVVMNLCTNAYHAMEESGGKLEVTLSEVEFDTDDLDDKIDLNPGKYLRLSVSDTGQGMTPDIIDKIFDPYYTTKELGKGTGLGLSVTHGIVKSHGGSISVYSEPGVGTTFHVYLPLIEKQVVPAETADPRIIQTGSERILLVDDEEPIVRMEQQVLERLGYQVTSRTSSVEAFEAFRAKPNNFDLVITDMTMPNMTGITLAERLFKIRKDIPIILCTGFSEHINGEKAKSIGIQAFVMKPVIKRDLANKIRDVLDNIKEE